MTAQDFLLTILTSTALSSMVIGLIMFIAKTWLSERIKQSIKAEYDEKLEAYKVKLSYESNIEIEKLKSSLAIAATQQNATFAELHNRRVDAIAEIYFGLMKFYAAVEDYIKIFEVTGGATRRERRDVACQASMTFTPTLQKNKIFLPVRIAKLIDSANSELISIANAFTFQVDQTNQPDTKTWIELTNKLNNDFKAALLELEKEMRQELGDKN